MLFIRCLVLFIATSLFVVAQNPYGRIGGRVMDKSGSVIPGVSVVAKNTATSVAVSTVSNDEGYYEITNLIPGRYILEAELPGFRRLVQGPVTLSVGDVLDIELGLEVGEVTNSITVTSQAPLLESASASSGQVVDNQQIVDLPLAGGNPLYLTAATGGVIQTTTPANGWLPQAIGPISNAVVAGTPNNSSEFTLDGIPNMSRGGMVAFAPAPEMVQEFRVETVPIDASVGHFTGGRINMVLKSGANAFHGDLFFSHLSTPLMTRPFFINKTIFDPTGGPVTEEKIDKNWPYMRTNRYRGSASGPVYIPGLYDGHNRTFWTFGLDWLDRSMPEQRYLTVPTEKQRQGDFSDLLAINASRYQIYDPDTITVQGARTKRLPFAGNIIPTNRLDPLALKLLTYYPLPNVQGSVDGQGNYSDPRVRVIDYKSQIVRIDHNISERHRLYGSLSLYQNAETWGKAFHNEALGMVVDRDHAALSLDDVYTLRPDLVLNLRYGMTRLTVDRGPQSTGFDLASLGFPSSLLSQIDTERAAFPNITIAGHTALGDQTFTAERTNNHVFTGIVSHIRKGHSLRFGSEYRIFQANDADPGNVFPAIEFGNAYTRGPLDNSPAAPIGQGLASFLLGVPTGGGIDRVDTLAASSSYVAFFAHDDWKVTPKLTLNFGLRYEYSAPIRERFNRVNRGFDFAAESPISSAAKARYALKPIPELPVDQFQTLGGLLFAGVNGVPENIWDGDTNNFSPRVGFAYRFADKMVVRAGYGLYFDSTENNIGAALQQGFSRRTAVVPTLNNGVDFIASLANPLPSGFLEPVGAEGGLATSLGKGLSFITPGLKASYVQRWTFNVQREFPRRVLVEVGYIGNRGTGLGVAEQLSPTPESYLSTSTSRDAAMNAANNFLTGKVPNPFAGMPEFQGTGLYAATITRAQLLSPYPHFTGISTSSNRGYSWYHGMTLRAEKRFSDGYSLSANYTWSKFMQATEKLNPTDAILQEVISGLDRPHRLVVNGIFQLPFGTGRRWLSATHPVLAHVLGGWSLQGIYQAQSGAPLGFGDIFFNGNLDDIVLPKSERTVERWFNTDAGFERDSALQPVAHIRTMPLRFSRLRGDGFNNFDMSLFKSFRLNEGMKLQVRAEAQNAFNHAIFADPIMSPANTRFGQITGGGNEQRRLTLGLKLTW